MAYWGPMETILVQVDTVSFSVSYFSKVFLQNITDSLHYP
jgi:hypothetical protein